MENPDWLWQHLKGVPAFRALLRAVESRFYQPVSWQRPMLDLGCGDGHFAQSTFVNVPPPDVGVDPALSSLHEAQHRLIYSLPVQAMGDRLPFAGGQFGSVISNSVLEHIPQVGRVVGELARVLRPGGTVLLTMPSERFASYLSIGRGLRRIGLDRAADAYEGWFNRISRHHHCDGPTVWHERLAAAGLRTVRWHYYFSPLAQRRLEWGHYLGLPSVFSRLLFGRWVIAPWRSSLQWTERWLRPAYEEPLPDEGAYLVFIAERMKPGETAGPLPPAATEEELTSPAAEPVEVLAGALATSNAATMPPTVEPGEELVTPDQAILAVPEEIPVGAQRVSSVRSLLWLGLALLLAAFGQLSWNWRDRPYQPQDGFTWYALALLMLAIFIWQNNPIRFKLRLRLVWRADMAGWRNQVPRVLMLIWAFLLSWFGWLLVQDQVQPPRGSDAAVICWAVGIALAVLALWPGAIGQLLRWERRLFPGLRGQPLVSNDRPGRLLIWQSWPRWEWLALAGLFVAAWLIRFVSLGKIPYVLSGDEASMGREAVRIIQGELGNPFVTGWFSHPTLYFYILSLPIRLFGQTVLAARFLSPFVGALTVLAVYFFARRAWGRDVALIASLLLAAYHFHVHYSRLALNNIWDPLFAVVELGLLWQSFRSGDRRLYVMAGLVLGVSQYFYMGSRMLLVLAGLIGLYWLARDWRRVWQQRSNFLALLVVALVVALPIVLFSIRHPDDYMARMNQLGIFQSGWLAREIELTGRSQSSILWEQFWKSALAFNYTVDPTFWYRPDIPLLRFWPSIFFVFGLGLAFWRSRRTPDFMLIVWLLATIFFGGFLLENPPSSQRYVIAAPAVCILVALALVWGGEQMRCLLGGRRSAWLAGLLLVALLFGWGDLAFYFGEYTPGGDFGGVNTEIAGRVSEYLLDLGPDWNAYFMGPPRMGIADSGGFPTVPFLAAYVRRVDVYEPLTSLDQLGDLEMPAVLIFLPERAAELQAIESRCPAGTEKLFPGRFDRMLFVSYELRSTEQCESD